MKTVDTDTNPREAADTPTPNRVQPDAAARHLPRRGVHALVLLLLVALTVAFFLPVLGGRTFSTVPGHQVAVYPWAATPNGLTDAYPQSDQADLSFPWQTFVSDTLNSGAFPLWEPHSFGGGYPFFANGQSAALYPPRLLTAALVGPGWAHDIFSMLHVFLAGLAMYGLMKEFGTGTTGSVFAAVSWMFAGFNMAWLHLEVVAPMSVFLPLVLLCVHRAVRVGTWSSAIVAGLTLGGALTSGHLVLLGLVYLVGVVYLAALLAPRTVVALRSGAWGRCATDAGRMAVVVGLSLGSAAVVLVPTMLVLGDSQRDPFTYAELTRSFLAPVGTFLHSFTPPPLPISQDRMHEMTFVGSATALFAVWGLLLRRPGAWLARGLLAATFLLAVGTPATWIAYRFIPGFDIFRPYSRLVIFWSFALAVLGGFGLDAFRQRGLAGKDVVATEGIRRWLHGQPDRRLRTALALAVVIVTTGQVVRYGRDINPPFVKRADASSYPVTPLIGALRSEVQPLGEWPGRILPVRMVTAGQDAPAPILFAAESLLFGIDTTGGYDSAVPRRVTALIRILQGQDPEAVLRTGLPSAYAPTFLSPETRFDLATRLGVTEIVTTPGAGSPDDEALPPGAPPTETVYDGPDGRVLRVLDASSGPRLVHRDDVAASEGEALRRFIDPDFDFKRSVVVESTELRRNGYQPLTGTGTGQVESASRGVNSSTIRVSSTSQAWLVVPTSWSPGWSATVNGRPAKVIRADYAKQAVQVPPGTSDVTLRYRPAGLDVGAGVSALTLLGAGTVLVTGWGRRRRAGRPGAQTPHPARR